MSFHAVLKYGDLVYTNYYIWFRPRSNKNKLVYHFRHGSIPHISNGRWHHKSNGVLRYKHLLLMSEKDTHPLSYDDESLGEVSFYKGKFKRRYTDIDWVDFDPKFKNYRNHTSWKINKKKKQWM